MKRRMLRVLPRFSFLAAACTMAAMLLIPLMVVAQEPPSGPEAGQAEIGRGLYRRYCASCHGESARGDGPIAAFLKVSPKNLTELEKDGAFPYEEVIQFIDGRKTARAHGRPDMPVWGEAFVNAESGSGDAAARAKIEAIVHFLWSVQEGGG